jgi:hypothetical protein
MANSSAERLRWVYTVTLPRTVTPYDFAMAKEDLNPAPQLWVPGLAPVMYVTYLLLFPSPTLA